MVKPPGAIPTGHDLAQIATALARSCDYGRMTERLAALEEHILQHRILPALMALREEFGYSPPEAIDAFSKRYDQLRVTRPPEFTVSREDYGQNFYS